MARFWNWIVNDLPQYGGKRLDYFQTGVNKAGVEATELYPTIEALKAQMMLHYPYLDYSKFEAYPSDVPKLYGTPPLMLPRYYMNGILEEVQKILRGSDRELKDALAEQAEFLRSIGHGRTRNHNRSRIVTFGPLHGLPGPGHRRNRADGGSYQIR